MSKKEEKGREGKRNLKEGGEMKERESEGERYERER